MKDNVIHADFSSDQEAFVSDMEDAVNGMVDVIYDYFDEDIACELAKGIGEALTQVAEKINDNLGKKQASD